MAYVPPHRRHQQNAANDLAPLQISLEQRDDDKDKRLRVACWSALKHDDATALRAILDGEGDSAATMLKLEHALWKDSAGKGPLESKRRGLVVVAASNTAGVPPKGALECLAMLLSSFPNDGSAWSNEQLELAENRARWKGRSWAVTLLQCVIQGRDIPQDIPPQEPDMPNVL